LRCFGSFGQRKLAEACQYALNQWTRLKVYFENGRIEIDQNFCENAMRALAVGRKNWLHLGSQEAGPRVGSIRSFVFRAGLLFFVWLRFAKAR
jgi:transposase